MAEDPYDVAGKMIRKPPTAVLSKSLSEIGKEAERLSKLLDGDKRSGAGLTNSVDYLKMLVRKMKDLEGQVARQVDNAEKVIAKAKGSKRSSSEHIASGLLKLAKRIVDNPLGGMRNREAKKFVNNLLFPLTKGFFRDDSWKGVQRIWKELDRVGFDWVMTDNKYSHDEEGRPSGKTWWFEVRFYNNNDRYTVLNGIVRAAGAGSIEDPLERYDLVAYVS